MRKLILLSSVAVVASAAAFAQTKAPQSFNYQGAVRNPNGTPLANSVVGLRLSIVADTENGAVQYYEVRNVTTNALGLYSVKINSPGALLNSASEGKPFTNIAWGAGDKYFRVEVDPTGGNNYTFAGSTPILSTPYAIYAEKGGTSGYNSWAAKPENAGKTPDDYLNFLKNQAAAQVASNAKNLTADNGGIDGLLTIQNGTGAVLTAASVNLDKNKFDQAARQAVTDGLNGTATDPSAAALVKALDGANAGLIADPNSESAKALGTAATTPGNPLNTGIDQAIGAAVKDPNSATSKGLIDGLVGPAGAPGANAPLQDAISQTVANGLGQNPAAPGSPAAALQDAVNKLISANTSGNGELKSNNDGADATQILTIADGANAAFHDATYTISKTALNKNTTDALTATDGANGANALQEALANANSNALNADPASPAQQAFQDAVKGTVTDGINSAASPLSPADQALQDALANGNAAALNADPANPAQQAFQDAANQNTADALAADPANPAQQAVKDGVVNTIADAIAASPAAPGSPAAALQDALNALVNANGEDFKTANATGDGTEANILQIGADNTMGSAAKSVLKEIDLRINQGALNKNTTDALLATDGTNGATALQNALSQANANALNTDPATATPEQKAFQDAINNTTADALNPTDAAGNPIAATPAQQAAQDAANQNAANALTADPATATPEQKAFQDALATSSAAALNADPANPAQQEFQDAINAFVNKNGEDFKSANADGTATDVNILQIGADNAMSDVAKSVLKEIDLRANKQAINNSVAAGIANADGTPGTSTALQDALNNNTATAFNADPATATPSQVAAQEAVKNNIADGLSSTADPASPADQALKDGVADAVTDALTPIPAPAGTPAAAMQDALNALISANTNGNGSLTKIADAAGNTNFIQLNGGANSTFNDVEVGVDGQKLNQAVAEQVLAAPFGDPASNPLADALNNQAAAALNADPANAAQQAFQDAINNTTADALNPKDADGNPVAPTPAQEAAQDAANTNTTNALNTDPAAAGSPEAALQEAIQNVAKAASETVTTGSTGTDATQILTVGTGSTTSQAATTFTALDLQISKTALNKNTTDALTATDGANGATALQEALNKGIATQLNPATATPDTDGDGVNDAIEAVNNLISANETGAGSLTNTGTENILTVNGAAASADGANATFKDVQLEVTKTAVQGAVSEGLVTPGGNTALKDALAQANADALNADPGTAAQQAFQQAVNQNAADGIQDALATPATAGAGDTALAEAIKDAAAQATVGNGTLSATENANGAATATSPVLTIVDPANQATFQDVAVNFDKEALKLNLAAGLEGAAATPNTGTAADNALAAAIGDAATKSAAEVTTKSDGTSATEILTIGATGTNQLKTTFANLDLKVSKLALNNNTADALTNPTAANGGTGLVTALDGANAKLIADPASATSEALVGSLTQPDGTAGTNPALETAVKNTVTAGLTSTASPLSAEDAALQEAVKDLAASAATGNVTATKDVTNTDVVSVVANTNTTFGNVVVNYSQEAANKAAADAITGTDANPQAAALKAAVENAAKSAISADNGLTEDPAGNIQLGGALTEVTTVTTTGTNTLAVAGLVDQSAAPTTYSQVLVQKADGTLGYATIASMRPKTFTDEQTVATSNANFVVTNTELAGVALTNIWVFKNGVRLPIGSYTIAGNAVTITNTAPAAAGSDSTGVELTTGDRILVQWVK